MQLAVMTIDLVEAQGRRLFNVEKLTRKVIRNRVECTRFGEVKPGCVLHDEYFVIVSEEGERQLIEAALIKAFNETVPDKCVPREVSNRFDAMLVQSLGESGLGAAYLNPGEEEAFIDDLLQYVDENGNVL